MVFNPYQFFKNDPKYKKLVGDDYLFLEFKCPIEVKEFQAWSECHYIVYVLDGKKKWRTPSNEWTVLAGESIFVQKGAYFNQLFLDTDLCVLMFFMTDDFIRSFILDDFLKNPKSQLKPPQDDPIYEINVTESLSVLYQSFFTYLNQDPRAPKKLVELKFRELLLNILTDPVNRKLREYLLLLATMDRSPLPRIMEENFCYNLGLDEFARICGRSLSSFKRDFRRHFKMSPGRWLTERRLKYASSLLVRTDKSVQEICYESGFENSSHFTRKFKDIFGAPPLQYRQDNASAPLQV